MFPQWSLDDIVLVDNAVYSFGFQLDNGIPIINYIQGKDDKQLLYLKEYLCLIANKNVIKDLKRTFATSQTSNGDLDSFVDYYGEEDIDEDNDVLLDQMFPFSNGSRLKGHSFNEQMILSKINTLNDIGSSSNHTEEEVKSLPNSQGIDDLPRTHSNNIDLDYCDQLIQSNEIDELFNNLQRSSDIKLKKKKNPKYDLSMMKKHQSVYYPPQNTLETKVLKPFLIDNLSHESSTKEGVSTPKRSTKKKTKKKYRTMKECKLGLSMPTGMEEEFLEDHPAEKINLFGKMSSGDLNSSEEDEDSSHSNKSQQQKQSLYVSTDGPRCSTFKNQKDDQFCRSAQFASKRNSSPLSNHSLVEDLKTAEKDVGKRKYSTSSESSDGDLERGEDLTTASNSKNHMSRMSSSETNPPDSKNSGLYTVTPFEKVIEAHEGEEYSPVHDRSRVRRDSLTEDLDGLKVFFSRSNGQKRMSHCVKKNDDHYEHDSM